jgi:hypothetical protein
MEKSELIEKLNVLCGKDWVELPNNKFSIPCPRDHFLKDSSKHPNFIYGLLLDHGQCVSCGLKTNIANLIAAIEEKIKSQPVNRKDANKESPKPSLNAASHFVSVGDILSQEFGEVEWLVDQIVPAPGIMALSGMPGDYKSWITLHVALSVARGAPVFGKFATKQGAVLIIDEENHLRYVQKRLHLLGATANDAVSYLSFSNFKADNEKTVATILREAQEKSIKLVVLDSLVNVHDQDENDAGGMSRVFQGIKQFLAADISVIFIHHHRKQSGYGPNNPAQSLRGSSNILAEVDSHISVERKPDSDVLILRHNKSRHAEPLASIEIKIVKNDATPRAPTGFEFVGTLDEKKKKAEEAADAVKMFLRDGVASRQQILEALKRGQYGEKAVDDGISEAVDSGEIELVPKAELPKGSRGNHYRITGKTVEPPLPPLDDEPNVAVLLPL